MKNTWKYRYTKVLSTLLALSVVTSAAVMPAAAIDDLQAPASVLLAAASNTSLSVSDALISLSDNKTFAVTYTMNTADLPEGLSTLSLWLTRTQDMYEDWQGVELDNYPHGYLGDALANWKTWDGTSPMFSIGDAETSAAGEGKTSVTFSVTTVPFLGNENSASSGNRNVWQSFIGDYTLALKQGETTLGETEMTVNMYDTYTRYQDIMGDLQEIQALAEAKGRYFNITSFGQSEGGRDQYYVTLSDSAASVSSFKAMNARAESDPAGLTADIQSGTVADYRIPFFINNVHPDECPGVDAQLNLLRTLATQDTITYQTLAGLKEDGDVSYYETEDGTLDMSMFASDVVDLGITGLGSQKLTRGTGNKIQNNTGTHDANELYEISGDIEIDVDELLSNLILIVCPNENPDGRTYNTRRNENGFDLNRDASNQTQSETSNITKVINEWNPVVFAELHGYMTQFLVEPCTPPHEPNMEYDILVKNFMLGSEAFGMAALGSMSGKYEDTKYWSYYTPLRDDYDPVTTTWSAWDDLCTNYTPSYAMLNCGSLGYTIETPYNNEPSTKLFEYGMYGLWDYTLQNKEDIYLNQLEFFRRGVENEDARDKMDSWYVNISNEVLDEDTWRVPYAENNNYFPEYYVIPVDAAAQRDPADAYAMAEFLMSNGVQVSTLTADTTIGAATYKAGSLIVDMHQAKRNYANAVLWEGADASASGFPDLYSESVSNFPEMRGFDCVTVTTADAFSEKLSELSSVSAKSQFSGSTGRIVVLENNGNEAVRAINALLDAGKAVGMITEGDHKGDYVMSYTDYSTVSGTYALVAEGVSTMPTAYQIHKPTLFLTGRYADFSNYTITDAANYYYDTFKDGYGFKQYRNVYGNGTSNYDVMAYDKQLGFTITTDPSKADVIVGNTALNSGDYAGAVEAVKSGTPYIAEGSTPLSYIKKNLLTDLDYDTLGMEALHTVEYPTDSLITASYAADGDYVTYTYNCAVLTAVPDGAEILIQATDADSFIAGCCLNEEGTPIDGYPEAFSLARDGMDVTVFANSINNRAHQQDDYRYVTNTIYSKMLDETPMTITYSSGSSSSGSSTTTTPTTPTTPVTPNTDATPSGTFSDTRSHWAADSIDYVVDHGLFTGTSATSFSPDAQMTRAMLATVLYRLADKPAAGSTSFSDVPSGEYYTDAVAWAAEKGIVTGSGNGRFEPNGNITREQLAAMLYRYAGAPGVSGTLSAFSDASGVSDWAQSAMIWAVENGIITGADANHIAPAADATRAEVATMLTRFAKLAA